MSERRKVLEQFELQKDYMEARCAEGIEKYRKGDGDICVMDENDAPIKGAKVSIRQKSHEFKYGANIFMLDEFETEEKNLKYRELMKSFGNMVTLPFYWNATEPEKGKLRYDKDSVKLYRRPPIDLIMEFCEENGIEPREHALAYDAHFADWAKVLSDDELKIELERRYREISERYADKINTIEVTNEMEWTNNCSSFYFKPDFIEWCFKLAEKYFPNNQLVINEYTDLCWADRCTVRDKYYLYIENALLKGARIDAIGMQYHMFYPKCFEFDKTRPFYSPRNLFRHMDMYAAFNKPLQVTEVTIPAYSNDPEDEQIQADIIEKLYPIWFSHPAVEQIIYWNMVDGYAHLWNPSPEKIAASRGDMTIGENVYYGGLFRFDLTAKPAYYAIKNLFEKVWHTEEAAETDENGCFNFRGFYGKYDVVVEADGKTVTKEINLSKNGDGKFAIRI